MGNRIPDLIERTRSLAYDLPNTVYESDDHARILTTLCDLAHTSLSLFRALHDEVEELGGMVADLQERMDTAERQLNDQEQDLIIDSANIRNLTSLHNRLTERVLDLEVGMEPVERMMEVKTGPQGRPGQAGPPGPPGEPGTLENSPLKKDLEEVVNRFKDLEDQVSELAEAVEDLER